MKQLENMTKEESVVLLKKLFREVGVVSTWKWDDAYRCVKTNPEYSYIRLSMQERKGAFAEHLHEAKEEER